MQQLDTRLRECYNELSPQEQRVASFIMDHFDDLMSYNSAELARLSGVSKATVSRLFKRLGYDRFKEMRDEVRTLRQSGMPLTENRDAVQGNTLLARHYKQEMANLTQWVNALDAVQFADVVQALGAAQRVFILGLRNSAPVALHLRQQLMQIRGQVSLMPQPGQTLAEELVDITPQDVVVVVAFVVVHGSSARYWKRCTNRACRLLPSANRRRRALPRLPAGTSACRSTAYRRLIATAVP